MAKKTKKDQNIEMNEKDFIARQKVEQLLADVDVISKVDSVVTTEEPDKDAIVSKEEKKSKNWLESQINELTEKNEKLEKELQDAKESFNKLSTDFVAYRKKVSVSESESELKQKIRSLYIKFENAYLGRNQSKEKFTHVKLSNPPNNTGVLDEFIKAFGDILHK